MARRACPPGRWTLSDALSGHAFGSACDIVGSVKEAVTGLSGAYHFASRLHCPLHPACEQTEHKMAAVFCEPATRYRSGFAVADSTS